MERTKMSEIDKQIREAEQHQIEMVIRDGHCIADKIANAKSLDELEELNSEIESFCDFVDNNYGEENDYGEMEHDLSTDLYVALDWKGESLESRNKNNEPVLRLSEGYMEDFLKYLDSKDWVSRYHD